jgi:PAS domain S-box-containing protein
VASGNAASGPCALKLNGMFLSVQYRTNRQVSPTCWNPKFSTICRSASSWHAVTRSQFMNHTLRSLFAGEFTSLADLASAFPTTAALSRSVSQREPVWISIGEAIFYVDPADGGGETLLALVPLEYTDPKNADLRELRELYNDFLDIFRNCFDGISVCDGNGRALFLNKGFERMYCIDSRDFIGRNSRELERLGYIDPLITPNVIATKERQSAVQRTKSGRSVMATGIPLFDDEGNVRKVIINSRDLTEYFELQERLSKAEVNLVRAQSELTRLRQDSQKINGVICSSGAMQAVVELALRLAKVSTTLLIQGESGVGKDVVARLIHAESPRCEAPFIKINCGAIPAELLESELFGYERGAFSGARREGKPGTLELAHEGTLFLDEIGDMPLALQVKLLQVLQDRTLTRVGGTKPIKVDFRLIAATNRDLQAMVREKAFREDLFYRLNVVPIGIPPLRERVEDIIPLAHHCLEEVNERYGYSRRFSGPVMDWMLRYSWPGNVRELRNIVERLVVTARSDEIGVESLPLELSGNDVQQAVQPLGFKALRMAHEADVVRAAVERFGSIGRAAAHLGISESTVKRKLRRGS